MHIRFPNVYLIFGFKCVPITIAENQYIGREMFVDLKTFLAKFYKLQGDHKGPVKPRQHKQFLCDKFSLFARKCPVYTSNFYLKTKDWRLGSIDDVKKNANFMCCLVYTDNFFVCGNFYLLH